VKDSTHVKLKLRSRPGLVESEPGIVACILTEITGTGWHLIRKHID